MKVSTVNPTNLTDDETLFGDGNSLVHSHKVRRKMENP
jgi:hypothetical protein